ncbi:hypothetical protein ACJBP2_10705, partial [Streptococcus suis]
TVGSAGESTWADQPKVAIDKAVVIYNRVDAKKVVPFEALTYNAGYETELRKVTLVITHQDNYKYV